MAVFVLFGVTTPFAWDCVDSADRLGDVPVCVDNWGGADPRLPNLAGLDGDVDHLLPCIVAPSSARHRAAAAHHAVDAGFRNFRSLVDPTAVVSRRAQIAHGAYVGAATVIGPHSTVGCHALINRSSSLGHNVTIAFGATIGPGATLTGGVSVGPVAFVGARATVLPGVQLGAGCIVGAGAVVTRSVGASSVVTGNPARPLRLDPLNGIPLVCPICSSS